MTATSAAIPQGPLAGIKILDLTSVILGPFATQILAQLGAEVIKVENAEGDGMRHVPPMKNAGMGHIFMHCNGGKKSIVLDLKQKAGKEILLSLAAQSDVMITNVRPRAMKRLGLDYESLKQAHPRLIYVSCVGFDQEGPDAAKPAYDDLIQGASGIAWLTQQYNGGKLGYPPVTIADRVTGLHATYAVTAALYSRSQTGQGQYVEVPMFEALSQFVIGDHLAGGSYIPAQGAIGYARLLTPYRKPYQTKDGVLCVLIYNDKHWKSFFEAIGEAERFENDPRFNTHTSRAANIEFVYGIVEQMMLTKTSAEWSAMLDGADIPNMPMNSPADLLTSPQLKASGLVKEVDHPSEGRMYAATTPTRWSGTPTDRNPKPAPRLGEHSREILSGLGFSKDAIDALYAAQAVK